ncbi:MAG: UDP-N-acetylmuramate dehydrogenase [Candidatus Sericytochromatia bacterium]|nr:UDP-N-acetylmuramate dehydrogenase [Candidatus Tanganyikabacteria bacterium]
MAVAARPRRPLAPITTWRVGGPAHDLLEPASADEVLACIRRARDEGLPWAVIGRGSNLLVADEGFPGIVIRLVDTYHAVSITEDRVTAQAGASTSALIKAGMEVGLGGITFLSSIPGSVGGAVFMNAGAHGTQTSDVLIGARVLEPDGQIRWRTPADLEMAYRHTALQDAGDRVVLEAAFRVVPQASGAIRKEFLEMAAWRRERQPQDPSAGSVFANPQGDSAGRLIEATGLKGYKVGGAMVSPVHANFFVNTGNATAADINRLIHEVRARVFEKHGVLLKPEVRGLGLVVGEV